MWDAECGGGLFWRTCTSMSELIAPLGICHLPPTATAMRFVSEAKGRQRNTAQ